MGVAAIIRSAVEAANAATESLQENVTLERYVGQDGFGAPTYVDSPESWPALVQRRQGKITRPDGQEISYRAVVSFLQPLLVDVRDRITLSDGVTGPLLDPQGAMLDPSTGQPYLRTVYLG